LGFGVRGLGFWVRGLGFGVWGCQRVVIVGVLALLRTQIQSIGEGLGFGVKFLPCCALRYAPSARV